MTEPEVIGMDEALVERVAALDIAKSSAVVCIRSPHASLPGRRTQEVFNTAATSNAIIDLANKLAEAGVTRVVMEATGAY